jgi:hypothetical protein
MSDLQHKSNKTMDNSGCLSSGHQSGSLRGQGDPSPIPPQCAASVPTTAIVKNAVKSCGTKGGKSVNLPPSGAAQTRQSAATADAYTPLPTATEVTPIFAPLQKSAPQGIGNGSTAAIHASINAAALADSGDNNVKYSPYCQEAGGGTQ